MHATLIIRVYENRDGLATFELALGHLGEYPRVVFRGNGPFPALRDEGADVRELLECLAEELFNWAPHATGPGLAGPGGSSMGDSESSVQLLLPGEMGGGGRGGPAGG